MVSHLALLFLQQKFWLIELKILVKILLEGKGITCIDLGVNVTPEVAVGAVKEYGAQLVCLSALLTTTMQNMKEVIEALTEAGLRDRVKIMVGGAPVTQEFADAIGADCYTADAVAAAKEAKRLLAEMNRNQGTDSLYPEN